MGIFNMTAPTKTRKKSTASNVVITVAPSASSPAQDAHTPARANGSPHGLVAQEARASDAVAAPDRKGMVAYLRTMGRRVPHDATIEKVQEIYRQAVAP